MLLWVHLLISASSHSPAPNPNGWSKSDAIYVSGISGKYVINVAYMLIA